MLRRWLAWLKGETRVRCTVAAALDFRPVALVSQVHVDDHTILEADVVYLPGGHVDTARSRYWRNGTPVTREQHDQEVGRGC